MTDGPLRTTAGELTPDEILSALEAGRRVIVTVEMLGSETDVALRHDGEIFYCDTPTRLHKHDDIEEMRTCIEKMGYAVTE
ncbi:MAG: hypothetical protein A07HR60_01132 [uncultured archaeon A07HR60]|nr:MAG: hypothetical protein A07HR60_01132 [uncultured archaeon A07HR60]